MNDLPEILGAFEPVEVIATGRMSAVVHATEKATGRNVVLKILHEHFAAVELVRRRFRREFAAIRRLDHPAIVSARDLIEDDEVIALVLDYVDGESVRRRVERQGVLDWEAAKAVLEPVLGGLEAAHRRGILHRDLNAEHILIDKQGRGKIIGFGMARVDELAALTMHTRVLGALEAMAPERVLGMDYDGRADLYSLGAVAHEMLLGHPPSEGTMHAAFARASGGETSLRDGGADDLPQIAQYVLERSLVGDMSARFATAAQMRRALDGIYDESMWRHWAARKTETCPECEAAVIGGLESCIDCGYRFRRLVRQPGAGTWRVRVLSAYDAFTPDVPFEANLEPHHLSDNQRDALMAFLGEYEDTSPSADGSDEYRWPPYILLEDLTREDADRVREGLDGCNIDSELVAEDGSSRRNSQIPRSAYAGLYLVPVLLAAFLWFQYDLGFPHWVVATSIVFVVAGLTSGLLLGQWWRRAAGNFTDETSEGGEPLMIPTERLTRLGSVGGHNIVPDDIGQILNRVENIDMRRQIIELLVLAMDVAERVDDERVERVRELVDQVIALGTGIDGLLSEIAGRPTPEIVDEVESLDVQIKEAGESERQALQERKDRCLEALDNRDRHSAEVSMAQGKFLRVRGALLDLRSTLDWAQLEADDEITLSFQQGPSATVEALSLDLEAVAEVEEVVQP